MEKLGENHYGLCLAHNFGHDTKTMTIKEKKVTHETLSNWKTCALWEETGKRRKRQTIYREKIYAIIYLTKGLVQESGLSKPNIIKNKQRNKNWAKSQAFNQRK